MWDLRNSIKMVEAELPGQIIGKIITEVMIEPPDLSHFERFRIFFDRSLFNWFIPALHIVIGVLAAVLCFYALNVENSILRYVFLSLAGIIVVTTIIAFITYNTEIPVCAILGIVIKERYVTNALSGLYFGTQALRWLFSLYFYDEHPEQSQPRSLSVCKIICLLLVLFCLVTIAFAYT